MGEPFLNIPNVFESIRIASGQKKIDLSSRRITISSCGIVPGILQLADAYPQVSLAISLHAPNDEARKRIMPVENTYPIDKLMEALDIYTTKTNKRIFYEYIMIFRLDYYSILCIGCLFQVSACQNHSATPFG